MENQTASKTLQEQVEREECDLVEVERGLEDTTQILAADFTKGHIDATMTMAGLQLVQDTREACARGDLEACGRLQLIRRFLGRVSKESAE